jgi:alpha-L-fucosidase
MGYTRRDILATGVTASAGSLLASIPLAGSVNNKPNKSCENAADLRPIQPTWNSLRTVNTPPQWLRDGKFGIYTHWGVYAVPAFGKNGTWYAHNMYTKPDSDERKHQEATYGPLDKFGYKDFIPMFTGKDFDPDEWAELFKKSGARFAGPVAEHHDGFAMWNTKYSDWNAAKMGPKRDVVGALSKSIKQHGMKFLTAFHHAEHWFYFPTWDKQYDVSDPRYSGLYGVSHAQGALPTKEFLDVWIGKLKEVVDNYGPDVVWFDYGLRLVQQSYKTDFLAYYFNKARIESREVAVTYKNHDLTPGVGIDDLELGRETNMTYYEWITDTTIDSGSAWGYVESAGFKSVDQLVTGLVDRVSKNGFLLLNVGPKPDGTIPAPAKERLLAMGEWLRVNGEAIFDTSPWLIAAEGPTQFKKSGAFNEDNDIRFTSEDIRFTCRDNFLYATVLIWPGDRVSIKSLVPKGDTWAGLYPSEIRSITMLGSDEPLRWEFTKDALEVTTPKMKPCDHAFVFKFTLKKPF